MSGPLCEFDAAIVRTQSCSVPAANTSRLCATAAASISAASSSDDVTTHPAFRNTARSFSDIYDRKRAPEHIDVMSYEENGERCSSWFLKPKNRG